MARRISRPKKGPSQRQLRVGELVRHLLSEVLNRGEMRDPALHDVSITVTEVRVSPDLQVATVFFLPLGGVQQEEVLEALKRSSAFLRGYVGHNSDLRYAPQLHFRIDTSFDEAKHIDDLLRSERVARDLAQSGDADLAPEAGEEE
ncbi:MAG: 30S ribosome-binding factor RbfA [Alphaproteobacteria bacterium]|nr:MAG: 30S ribosome-binding factor RbfA [Alphaproteobacteria bacterium]